MSYDEWDVWTRGSAIRRAGCTGFKRNVAVAMGNWLAATVDPPAEALEVLREALEDDEALVREHAEWALARYEQSGEDQSETPRIG
jgi:epoxyqueuosine reductase